MIFLLLFAVVSLSLAITAMIRYPLPASIFSRVILVSWLVAVIFFIVVMCRHLWKEAHAHGTHMPHAPHVWRLIQPAPLPGAPDHVWGLEEVIALVD
jgi:hypothetical protein